jgi:Cu2+-exporting ATPase
MTRATVVLHTCGLRFGDEKAVVERVLSRGLGVLAVSANPVSQTATVTFDPAKTSVAELTRCVEGFGYRSAGQSVPNHVCDAMEEPASAAAAEHEGHRMQAADHPAHAAMRSPHEAMGHGGHAAMSMDAMARDMRRGEVPSPPRSVMSNYGNAEKAFGLKRRSCNRHPRHIRILLPETIFPADL